MGFWGFRIRFLGSADPKNLILKPMGFRGVGACKGFRASGFGVLVFVAINGILLWAWRHSGRRALS